MDIVELQTADELRESFPVMRQLRTHLDADGYLELLRIMMARGYRLLAVRDDGRIVALAGIEIRTSLHIGRHVWVYDLVSDGNARSRGYGRTLLSYVEDLARRDGCGVIALNSGLQRVDAHRFYEQHMGFDRVSYSFSKRL
jgi:GNAT superfamily N-acetyltransferase